ncbi:MAG: cysteine desulfurase [Actinobacteria bacterium]|nr:cysteine desulfurase [Actinomycetota bacterium]
MPYLDYAATTPILDEVLEAMAPYQRQLFGNPSSVYETGREGKKGMEEARDLIAAAVGAQPAEIIFTGGGTEADNLALKGPAFKLRSQGNHIITTAVEHHAVLHSAEWLEKQGFRVTFLGVDQNGLIDLERLKSALTKETILVSIMLVNNEVGVIEPVAEAVRIVKENSRALFHSDAVQALGKLKVNLDELGVDLASFSAHKVGGPKGTGALFVKRGTPIEPVLHGGGQERDLRSGTPNVAGIVGFGVAAQIAAKEVEQEAERLTDMRDQVQEGIKASIERVHVNAEDAPRIGNTLNVCIEGVEGESLLLMLDSKEVAASSGSACTSGSLDPSHVLMAMGVAPELAHGSLRVSLGRATTSDDIDDFTEVLPAIVDKLRSIAPRSVGGR